MSVYQGPLGPWPTSVIEYIRGNGEENGDGRTARERRRESEMRRERLVAVLFTRWNDGPTEHGEGATVCWHAQSQLVRRDRTARPHSESARRGCHGEETPRRGDAMARHQTRPRGEGARRDITAKAHGEEAAARHHGEEHGEESTAGHHTARMTRRGVRRPRRRRRVVQRSSIASRYWKARTDRP